jgi:hypothetical protein
VDFRGRPQAFRRLAHPQTSEKSGSFDQRLRFHLAGYFAEEYQGPKFRAAIGRPLN